MAGAIVRGVIVVLLGSIFISNSAFAQPRRNGRNGRPNQGPAERRQDNEVAPVTAPIEPPNPLVTKLLEGYGWQDELSKVGPGPSPASLRAKFDQWVKQHSGPIRGSVVAAFVPASKGSGDGKTLNFESRGTLSDGARYHLMVEVQADGVTNADAPAKGAYVPGKLYVISGATDGHPIGEDYPRGPRPGAKPGVGLTLEYDAASIKVYDPPKQPPAPAGKPAPENAAPAAKANVVPVADRPDVLLLVHPSNRNWIPTLQEWAQPKVAMGLFTTKDEKGVVAAAKVRVDAGTSPANFKKWMYALVLDQLVDDQPMALGPVSKLSYTLYYRADEKDRPTMLVQGTINGIVTRGTPNGFVRGLVSGQIHHDIAVALGEKVYGRDAGRPLINGGQSRREIAHRVQISKVNAQDIVTFPLENKFPMPIGVTLTVSRVRQVPTGWTFDDTTASTDRITLEPGEKYELKVPVKEFEVTVESAVAYAIFMDERLMPYAK
jgi:hypothetical protein